MTDIYTLLQTAAASAALFFTDEGGFLFVQREPETGAVTSKTLRTPAVVEAFTQVSLDTGYLPKGLVRLGTRRGVPWYAQFQPPGPLELRLQMNTQVRTVNVRMPALLFVAFGRACRICTLKTRRFDPLAPVFHAPLPNLSSSGAVCWGPNEKYTAKPENAGPIWGMFCHTPFSAHNAQNRSKRYPDDVRQVLISRDGLKRPYPAGDLLPQDITAGRFIDRAIGG